jgi:effector-binding domain-containing protein
MIDTPQITQSVAQLTAVIHVAVPRNEIQQVMGPGLNELMSALAAQGIAPVGPWFTRHLRIPTDSFDFEISVPVAAPVVATGRVKPSRLPSMKVARTIYHGSYEGLGDAWGEFRSWVKTNGHTPAENLWECYLTDPSSNPDPATWRTELNCPLIAR